MSFHRRFHAALGCFNSTTRSLLRPFVFSNSKNSLLAGKPSFSSSRTTRNAIAAGTLLSAAASFSSYLWCYADSSPNSKPEAKDPFPRAPLHNVGAVLPVPSKGKLVFVGDVHGCYEELTELLNSVKFRPEEGDLLVLMGDLIGKGPDSLRVLQFAMSLGSQCAIVRGNHEQVIVDWRWKIDTENRHIAEQISSGGSSENLDNSPPEIWASFSEMSDDVCTHRECAMAMSEEEWGYLLRSPLWIHFPEINSLAVHAGIFPLVPLENQNPRELMNIRSLVPQLPLTPAVLSHLNETGAKGNEQKKEKRLGDSDVLFSLSEELGDLRGVADFLLPSNKIDPNGALWAEVYSTLSVLLQNERRKVTDLQTGDVTTTASFPADCLQGALHSLPHIIFGHDAKSALQIHANATGLDTGCCYGRKLTALVFEKPGATIKSMKKSHGLRDNMVFSPPPTPRKSSVGADATIESSAHFLKPYFVQVQSKKVYQGTGKAAMHNVTCPGKPVKGDKQKDTDAGVVIAPKSKPKPDLGEMEEKETKK